MVNIYLVRHTNPDPAVFEPGDFEDGVWWSNEGGWAEIGEAIVFTPAEAAELNLPFEGEWVSFESGAPDCGNPGPDCVEHAGRCD